MKIILPKKMAFKIIYDTDFKKHKKSCDHCKHYSYFYYKEIIDEIKTREKMVVSKEYIAQLEERFLRK